MGPFQEAILRKKLTLNFELDYIVLKKLKKKHNYKTKFLYGIAYSKTLNGFDSKRAHRNFHLTEMLICYSFNRKVSSCFSITSLREMLAMNR